MKNKSLAFKQTSGAAAAVGISSIIDATLVSSGSILPTVSYVLIQVETNSVRWRDDGTAPTAAVGHLLAPGQYLFVPRSQFANFKLIETAVAAVVNVTAYSGDGVPFLPSGAGQAVTISSGTVTLGAGTAIAGKFGIDQTTPGTTDSVTVKSAGYSSQPTVTRPANTTAYTAGDVVGGAITFSSIGPTGGGHVMISGVDLRIDIAAIPAGMTTFRLHLYNVTPPSAIADNSAWDLPSGDRSAYLGYIDVGTPADLGSTCFVQTDNLNKKLLLASANVYGYLVTTAGYTPAANSEVYTPRLQAVGM